MTANEPTGRTAKAEVPSRGRFYRPELDVVRFVAFFCVFLFHSLVLKYFFQNERLSDAVVNFFAFGLCLFFVLSAFLISDLLMREKKANGYIDLKAFYSRRILRIWPLYIVGLAMGALYAHFMYGGGALRFVALFFFLGSFYTRRYGWQHNPSDVLWSISVEEQFYLLYAVVARTLGRKGIVAVCAALIALANGFLFYYGQTHASTARVVWMDSFVQFEMFAAGILLAVFLKQRIPKLGLHTRLALLISWPVCWFVSAYYFQSRSNIFAPQAASGFFMVTGYALIAFGCMALMLALMGIEQKFLPRWMIYGGKISYGLYVFHEYGLRASGFIFNYHRLIPNVQMNYLCWVFFGLTFTFILASLSYRFFELPFLKLKPERI